MRHGHCGIIGFVREGICKPLPSFKKIKHPEKSRCFFIPKFNKSSSAERCCFFYTNSGRSITAYFQQQTELSKDYVERTKMKNIYEILADYGLEIPQDKKEAFDNFITRVGKRHLKE